MIIKISLIQTCQNAVCFIIAVRSVNGVFGSECFFKIVDEPVIVFPESFEKMVKRFRTTSRKDVEQPLGLVLLRDLRIDLLIDLVVDDSGLQEEVDDQPHVQVLQDLGPALDQRHPVRGLHREIVTFKIHIVGHFQTLKLSQLILGSEAMSKIRISILHHNHIGQFSSVYFVS